LPDLSAPAGHLPSKHPPAQKKPSVDALELFKHLDHSGDGRVSKVDLRKAVREDPYVKAKLHLEGASMAQVDAIFDDMDHDHTRSVDVHGLDEWMATVYNSKYGFERKTPIVPQARQIMRLLDTHNGQTVTKWEVTRALREDALVRESLGLKAISKENMQKVIAGLPSGSLRLRDLSAWIQKHVVPNRPPSATNTPRVSRQSSPVASRPGSQPNSRPASPRISPRTSSGPLKPPAQADRGGAAQSRASAGGGRRGSQTGLRGQARGPATTRERATSPFVADDRTQYAVSGPTQRESQDAFDEAQGEPPGVGNPNPELEYQPSVPDSSRQDAQELKYKALAKQMALALEQSTAQVASAKLRCEYLEAELQAAHRSLQSAHDERLGHSAAGVLLTERQSMNDRLGHLQSQVEDERTMRVQDVARLESDKAAQAQTWARQKVEILHELEEAQHSLGPLAAETIGRMIQRLTSSNSALHGVTGHVDFERGVSLMHPAAANGVHRVAPPAMGAPAMVIGPLGAQGIGQQRPAVARDGRSLSPQPYYRSDALGGSLQNWSSQQNLPSFRQPMDGQRYASPPIQQLRPGTAQTARALPSYAMSQQMPTPFAAGPYGAIGHGAFPAPNYASQQSSANRAGLMAVAAELFRRLDDRGNGVILKLDLLRALREDSSVSDKLGLPLFVRNNDCGPRALEACFGGMDFANDQYISQQELVFWLERMRTRAHPGMSI